MLKIQTTNFGNVAVLCVQGRIVRGEAEALRKAVLAQAEKSVIVLDLARVGTIDAGGLGVLLALRAETQSKGIEFRFTNVRKLVRQVLEVTRLDSVFEVTSGAEILAPRSLGRVSSVLKLAACA